MGRGRKLAWIAGLYFAQGLPFGVVKEIWPVYFRVHGVSLEAIGAMNLLGLPWTLKILWAPLVDRYGTFARWIVGPLVLMALASVAVPGFDPRALDAVALRTAWAFWMVLLVFTLASATQDIAIDAYTIGLVSPGEEGEANGVRVSAYRVALIAAGGGLVVAGTAGWPVAFAAVSAVLLLAALGARRLPAVERPAAERRAFVAPMRAWLAQPGAAAVFAFVLLYKLGDAAMGPMVKPLWVDRGFAVAEIGLVTGSAGVVLTIAGALLGGWLTSRLGLWPSLWALGLAQALSNLGYAAVAWADLAAPAGTVTGLGGMLAALGEPARLAIYGASALESFTGGLGTAAFLAFLMHICDKAHAAVQYAALSAVFAFSRDLAGAASGWATARLGYADYFVLTFALALPAFALLPLVRGWIRDR